MEHLKQTLPADITVGGPELAARAMEAGLVDECHVFLDPVTVGAGKPALPAGLALQLLGQRQFDSGVVHLHYRVNGGPAPDGANMQGVNERSQIT